MTISVDRALSIVSKAVEAARGQQVPIVAVVTDLGGHVVALARMDGVSHVNTDVARRKAVTAAAFKMPTHEFIETVSRDQLVKTAVMNDPQLNALPGGVPLIEGGEVAGAVGVAGGFYLQDRAIAEYAAA